MKYKVKLEPTDDGNWIVLETFTCCGVTVPEGFETDLSSVPWLLQWLIKKGGKKTAAGVTHDFSL